MQDGLEAATRKCIANLLACHEASMTALARGAADTERVTLIISLTELCRVSAHFLTIGSPHHHRLVAECAEICETCAAECADMDGLTGFVASCRQAAACCRALAA